MDSNCCLTISVVPRVEELDTGVRKVLDVACRNGDTVAPRDGADEPIEDRKGAAGPTTLSRNLSPASGGALVERQDALAVGRPEIVQPNLELTLAATIGQEPATADQLTDGHRAQQELGRATLFEPTHDALVGSRSNGFRDNAGVQ